jgi:hypothetical protein
MDLFMACLFHSVHHLCYVIHLLFDFALLGYGQGIGESLRKLKEYVWPREQGLSKINPTHIKGAQHFLLEKYFLFTGLDNF